MNNFKNIKLCFAPISKNFVDALIEYSNETNVEFILIPSRRQIDYDGGYVNNWNTESFYKYIKSKTNNIFLERDHGGPSQGKNLDDGLLSFKNDCKYFDIIHIDPWLYTSNLEEGFKITKDLINYCYELNPNIYYEISTEQSIRKLDVNELEKLIQYLKIELNNKIYNKIVFLVIQIGTALKNGENIGDFEKNKLENMIKLKEKYNFLAKEHNGDWVHDNEIKYKFANGLNALNIAPELGTFETKIYLENIKKNNDDELFNYFYELCLKSGKWKKWVSDNFIPENNKEKLIEICGHYIFSHKDFNKIKEKFIDIDIVIKNKFKNKIKNKLELTYN